MRRSRLSLRAVVVISANLAGSGVESNVRAVIYPTHLTNKLKMRPRRFAHGYFPRSLFDAPINYENDGLMP